MITPHLLQQGHSKARSSMRISIRLCANYGQNAGFDRLTVELPEGNRVSDLLKTLKDKFHNPDLTDREISTLIHHQVASPETVLHDGDEVLLLPIMEGG